MFRVLVGVFGHWVLGVLGSGLQAQGLELEV